MKGGNFHVVPEDHCWIVEEENSEKPKQRFTSKSEAVIVARVLARQNGVQYLVYGANSMMDPTVTVH